jgi:toxin ParE1/3/4
LIVVLSDGAEADPEAIGDWIAQDAPTRAISFVAELREACEILGKRPLAFPLLNRRNDTSIRKRTYGARDYERILFPE